MGASGRDIPLSETVVMQIPLPFKSEDYALAGLGAFLCIFGVAIGRLTPGSVLVWAAVVFAAAALIFLTASWQDWGLPQLIFLVAVLSMWTAHAMAMFGLANGYHAFREMQTAPDQLYYAFTLPALGFFAIGLATGGAWPQEANWAAVQQSIRQQPFSIFLPAFLGVSAWLVQPFVPDSARLPVHLSIFLLIAVWPLYLLFWENRFGVIALLVWLPVVVYSMLQSTMFGPGLSALMMLGWGFFIQKKTAAMVRVLVLSAGLVMVVALLSFKFEYREQAAPLHKPVDKIKLFVHLGWERLSHPAENPNWRRVLLRLDQGHLTGKVLTHVPLHEPFAQGETLLTALKSVIVPRFLWPDKPLAGGRYVFARFTGESLGAGISKNVGQFAEAYANFGRWGAWICLFAYGFMLRIVYEWFKRLQTWSPHVLLWLPFVFAATMTVEKDFLTSVNYLAKAGIMALVLLFVLKKCPYSPTLPS